MITLNLPWPPSVNRIWRQGKGRVYLDKKYQSWRDEADKVILSKRREIGPMIKGRFTIQMTLDDRKRLNKNGTRKRIDAGNRAKVILDCLERMRVIEDDALADSEHIEWGFAEGVRVSIVPIA